MSNFKLVNDFMRASIVIETVGEQAKKILVQFCGF